MEEKTRDTIIAVTVNDEEKEYLRKKAKEAKLTLAAYCRLVLFGGGSNITQKLV